MRRVCEREGEGEGGDRESVYKFEHGMAMVWPRLIDSLNHQV